MNKTNFTNLIQRQAFPPPCAIALIMGCSAVDSPSTACTDPFYTFTNLIGVEA